MTVEELEELFEKHRPEHGKFDRVEPKLSKRKDMHAFILLDLLVPGEPGENRIIGAAEHDQIWIGIDIKPLAAAIPEDRIIELIRCGIRYDERNRSLCMFA